MEMIVRWWWIQKVCPILPSCFKEGLHLLYSEPQVEEPEKKKKKKKRSAEAEETAPTTEDTADAQGMLGVTLIEN